MKAHSLSVLSAVMYFICFIAFFCLMATDVTVLRLSHTVKIITAFLVFVSGFLGAYIKCRNENAEKRKLTIRRTVTLLFFAYVFIIIDFTLIDDSFGRTLSNIFLLESSEAEKYLIENTNFIPFETIKLFANAYKSETLSTFSVLENILGNFCVMMPTAFFIPAVFKSVKSFKDYISIIALCVVLIELLQLVFLSGSGDIDDFLLNVSGAALGYGILKIPFVSRYLAKLTYGVWK